MKTNTWSFASTGAVISVILLSLLGCQSSSRLPLISKYNPAPPEITIYGRTNTGSAAVPFFSVALDDPSTGTLADANVAPDYFDTASNATKTIIVNPGTDFGMVAVARDPEVGIESFRLTASQNGKVIYDTTVAQSPIADPGKPLGTEYVYDSLFILPSTKTKCSPSGKLGPSHPMIFNSTPYSPVTFVAQASSYAAAGRPAATTTVTETYFTPIPSSNGTVVIGNGTPPTGATAGLSIQITVPAGSYGVVYLTVTGVLQNDPHGTTYPVTGGLTSFTATMGPYDLTHTAATSIGGLIAQVQPGWWVLNVSGTNLPSIPQHAEVIDPNHVVAAYSLDAGWD